MREENNDNDNDFVEDDSCTLLDPSHGYYRKSEWNLLNENKK